MWRGHEIVSYLVNRTRLVDEARVMTESPRTTTITGVRKRADGSEQSVRIEIRDSGGTAGDLRYAVSVYPEGAQDIIANEAGSLDEAISNADAHSSGLG